MEIEAEKISLHHINRSLGLVFSNTDSSLVYLFTATSDLIALNILENKILKKWKILHHKLNLEEPINLVLSKKDQFISITNKYGQFGIVYNLISNKNVLELDRKNYHIEHSVFPNIFYYKNSKIYLIHTTDWNHIEIFDFQANKNITNRINEYQSKFYLDYFYGELHLSPNHNWVVSSGWVWGPASRCKFINLNQWLESNINEPETAHQLDILIGSYYWDRAVCWINDHSLAYLYDPREEQYDDEEYLDLKIKNDRSYILIYDLNLGEIVKRIEFDNFSKNEYFEATADAQIFCSDHNLVVSSGNGISIIDIETHEILYENKLLQVENYAKEVGVFYDFRDKNDLILYKIKK